MFDFRIEIVHGLIENNGFLMLNLDHTIFVDCIIYFYIWGNTNGFFIAINSLQDKLVVALNFFYG